MTRGSSASHSATVSLPEFARRRRNAPGIARRRDRPRSRNPRSRRAGNRAADGRNRSRRNSCVWASKSTTTSRPEGASARAASCKRPGRVVEEVQHLMDDDQVVAVALDRRGIDVALAELHVAQARLIDAAARQGQHRRALVDADGADRARGEKLQHASGAGAEIEQAAERLFADQSQKRRLDPLLGGVQGANAVPIGRLLGEIGRRLASPRLAGDLEPGAGRPPAPGRRDRDGGRDRGRIRRPNRRGGRTPRRPRAAARRGPPRSGVSGGATRAAATGRGWRRAR